MPRKVMLVAYVDAADDATDDEVAQWLRTKLHVHGGSLNIPHRLFTVTTEDLAGVDVMAAR